MKYNKLLWLLAMALAVPQMLCSQTDGNSHYIYFANGNVKAFPKEYVKELDNDGGRCTITLVNDSTISWNASEIAEISDVKPDYPRFTFF